MGSIMRKWEYGEVGAMDIIWGQGSKGVWGHGSIGVRGKGVWDHREI